MILSQKENTINYALNAVISEICKYKTIPELYSALEKATVSIKDEKTRAKREELLSKVKNSKNFTRALTYVYDFYLKGDGQGVLKVRGALN